MAMKVTHELHKRRFSRNLGVGVALGAFVVLVFALTVVKLPNQPMEGFDHAVRPSMTIPESGQGGE